jgi:protein-disulfide isomerase-like protein with CxxC motif
MIAIDEARKLYSHPDARAVAHSRTFDLDELRAYQRAAYFIGRTAAPTEAEIEAAAIEMYRQELCTICDCEATTDEAIEALYEMIGDNAIADDTRRMVHERAALVLESGRKKVME